MDTFMMSQDFVEVGIVKAIYRYPVKSMQGEALQQTHVYWHGLDGDRRWAFVQANDYSGFPWLTGREIPQLVRYVPSFVQPDDVAQSPIQVTTPNGRILPLQSPDLRNELTQTSGVDIDLIKIGRGTFDSQSLSLMTLATADALGQQAGMDIHYGRFRQNLLIETFSNTPYQEESWLDGLLLLGDRSDSAHIRLNRRIQRCVMVNIDPETAEKDPRILKTVAQHRQNCVGVYASTEKTGLVRVGDPIRLIK